MLAIEFGVVLVIVAGLLVVVESTSTDESVSTAMNTSTAVTVDLAVLPESMADVYHYAASHATDFDAIPCYCGCDRSLGHVSLTDCFITDTGAWDAHASGCAVCSNEATTARAALDAGAQIDRVAASIIAVMAAKAALPVCNQWKRCPRASQSCGSGMASRGMALCTLRA